MALNLSSFLLATLQHLHFDTFTNAFNVLLKKWLTPQLFLSDQAYYNMEALVIWI